MNISIITPGGCSAKCDFCFWELKKTPKIYMSKLYTFLLKVEPNVHSLSITGGEPTESIYFYHILKMISDFKHKFTKVVLTTNASNLYDFITIPDNSIILQQSVDHINISRHHYNENINSRIFNSKNVPSNEDVMQMIILLNQVGIDVTFNCVLTNMMETKDDIINFIVFAKNSHASAVTFRDAHDGDTIEINSIEKLFDTYKTVNESSCGACRIATKLIAGIKCNFHYSVKEPTKVMHGIYELIVQQDGVVTLDWDGKLLYSEVSPFDDPNSAHFGCGGGYRKQALSGNKFQSNGGCGGRGDGGACSHGTYFKPPRETVSGCGGRVVRGTACSGYYIPVRSNGESCGGSGCG